MYIYIYIYLHMHMQLILYFLGEIILHKIIFKSFCQMHLGIAHVPPFSSVADGLFESFPAKRFGEVANCNNLHSHLLICCPQARPWVANS